LFFFNSQGIVNKEFVPQGQTQSNFLWEVLERHRKWVELVRPGIARTWLLHHDNAPCHTAVSINDFLAEKSMPVVPQPPFSPDLSPCDFFLFPRLKNHLKGRHIGTFDNIQKSVTDELKGIPAEAFQHCYEQWKQRLRRCVVAQGNYFEADNLYL
jgi:hypothetical protein